MRLVFLVLLLFCPSAYGYKIENYPFEEFRKRLCQEKSCIDIGSNHVMIAGDESAITFTRSDFEGMKSALVSRGINFEEGYAFSEDELIDIEIAVSEIGVGTCDAGKVACGAGALAGTLYWPWRVASAICLMAMPKCIKHYEENITRLRKYKADKKERERIEKGKEEAESNGTASAGGGGGDVLPPESPHGSGAGGGTTGCHWLPGYAVTSEGHTAYTPGEMVCGAT